MGNAIPPPIINFGKLARSKQRGHKVQIVTYSKERVTQDELAVDVKNVHIKEFAPRARAGPQVKAVVDDRKQSVLDLLLQVPHHCLQGRPQANANTDEGR